MSILKVSKSNLTLDRLFLILALKASKLQLNKYSVFPSLVFSLSPSISSEIITLTSLLQESHIHYILFLLILTVIFFWVFGMNSRTFRRNSRIPFWAQITRYIFFYNRRTNTTRVSTCRHYCILQNALNLTLRIVSFLSLNINNFEVFIIIFYMHLVQL